MIRKWFLITFMLLFALTFAACAAQPAAPAQQPVEAPAAEQPAEEPTAPAEAQQVRTWFQYDQNNEDPASDERVGNEYLRNTIPQFNEAHAGQLEWVNQPKAFDKMTTELVAAVQAGGDVPDIFELSNTQDLIDFYRNGTAQDLTEWAQTQPWWGDLDQSSINACKAPDDKLYCVPISVRPQLVYVWNDRFPNGFPTTPEEFLTEAERLKGEGLYGITFFGSTDKGGEGLTRAVWTIIDSFGGALDDGQGNMKMDTPETIAAIEFLREIIAQGYVPEIAFAGGFQEEEAFKDASAGSFPTGLFGYRYVNPLTAPNGTKYDTGTSDDMINAIDAGDVILAPSFASEGQTPGCGIDVQGFVIPVGAENVDGAHEFINWMMSNPAQNADYVIGPGGGFPTLKAIQASDTFQTKFYVEAASAIGASDCNPWYGSLARPNEAQEMVMQAIYRLIKEDPSLDIATELQKVQDEYNAAN
ncbi:MAG: extracellular solute-binding protein [Caldilineales bacterium]|nr:extracellular solute-binding protein [Caldilineales bacterium]